MRFTPKRERVGGEKEGKKWQGKKESGTHFSIEKSEKGWWGAHVAQSKHSNRKGEDRGNAGGTTSLRVKGRGMEGDTRES